MNNSLLQFIVALGVWLFVAFIVIVGEAYLDDLKDHKNEQLNVQTTDV